MRGLAVLLSVLVAAPGFADSSRARAEREMVAAKAAMELQEWERAIEHLEKARLLAPDASGPYLNLGIAYERLGRCGEAVEMIEAYLHRKKTPHEQAAEILAACARKAEATPAPTMESTSPSGTPTPSPSTTIPSPSPATESGTTAAGTTARTETTTAAPPPRPPPVYVAPPDQRAPYLARPAPPRQKHTAAIVGGVIAGVVVTAVVITLAVVLGGSASSSSSSGPPPPSEVGFPTAGTR
jgi:hypothetical protein